MTLAHSSPPCSQMCRYSCHWMTPPCTSLSLLTWGCPCVAWRFSTNHWPLTSTTSRLLTPPSTTLWPPKPLLLPLPHRAPSTSCGTSCVWQVGVQTLFLCSDPFIPPSVHHTGPFPFSLPACEKAVYAPCPPLYFSLSISASICMFFPCLSFLFCRIFTRLNGLIWWVKEKIIAMLF